ncbi:MAG: Ribosomal protein L18 [Parcubacteria group bacterium GW2011_GWF2_39_8b]|nr:MAG: Ribosomal protein L18 [Parcubacteria group bacterium GW2011_GWF2_39_8b]KKR46210.1 MAG: Ribosomal protein L18 [Parcubacteria group bacterium GW2011_GWA2_40_14]
MEIMKSSNVKKEKRIRRHARIRAKISGTADLPRLSVFKSNKHISVQLIDDQNGQTLASAHSRDVKGKTMMEKAGEVGQLIAEKAKAKKITEVAFDRGGFIYTGNIKTLADGARKGGLHF